MKARVNTEGGLFLGVAMFLLTANALAECETVRGRIVSELVTVFSDGNPCTSELALCTEGRFTGDLKGRFKFVANTLTPYGALDPTSPQDVAAVTGVNVLQPRNFCDGTLVFTDTSAFSLTADGYVGGLENVDGDASTGDCSGATGRIRIEGVFLGGCVDCRYRGEICMANDDAGDDEDDEDDD